MVHIHTDIKTGIDQGQFFRSKGQVNVSRVKYCDCATPSSDKRRNMFIFSTKGDRTISSRYFRERCDVTMREYQEPMAENLK